jgi:predicted metalloprotease with PDZ domain
LLSPVADDAAENEEDTPVAGSMSSPPRLSEGVPPAATTTREVERGSRLDEPSAPPPWLQTGAGVGADVATKVITKAGTEKTFGMGISPGLLIGDVKVDGAAARAGLRDGMQIVSVMGERVIDRSQVLTILKSLAPKQALTIELRWSNGAPQQPASDMASQLADAKERLRLHMERMEAKAMELAELKQRAAALRAGATK